MSQFFWFLLAVFCPQRGSFYIYRFFRFHFFNLASTRGLRETFFPIFRKATVQKSLFWFLDNGLMGDVNTSVVYSGAKQRAGRGQRLNADWSLLFFIFCTWTMPLLHRQLASDTFWSHILPHKCDDTVAAVEPANRVLLHGASRSVLSGNKCETRKHVIGVCVCVLTFRCGSRPSREANGWITAAFFFSFSILNVRGGGRSLLVLRKCSKRDEKWIDRDKEGINGA